eukprot:TRINITY_DN1866_c0_g1_i1.p1 TRINITY_DN1866_c0_g1~~TRINITY_DN1866_c0_g1_i1.p1  ORF type:complete len:636 (-),score=218.51 TRINITY_DN1866_c0_g1_i1:2526-4433(-)
MSESTLVDNPSSPSKIIHTRDFLLLYKAVSKEDPVLLEKINQASPPRTNHTRKMTPQKDNAFSPVRTSGGKKSPNQQQQAPPPRAPTPVEKPPKQHTKKRNEAEDKKQPTQQDNFENKSNLVYRPKTPNNETKRAPLTPVASQNKNPGSVTSPYKPRSAFPSTPQTKQNPITSPYKPKSIPLQNLKIEDKEKVIQFCEFPEEPPVEEDSDSPIVSPVVCEFTNPAPIKSSVTRVPMSWRLEKTNPINRPVFTEVPNKSNQNQSNQFKSSVVSQTTSTPKPYVAVAANNIGTQTSPKQTVAPKSVGVIAPPQSAVVASTPAQTNEVKQLTAQYIPKATVQPQQTQQKNIKPQAVAPKQVTNVVEQKTVSVAPAPSTPQQQTPKYSASLLATPKAQQAVPVTPSTPVEPAKIQTPEQQQSPPPATTTSVVSTPVSSPAPVEPVSATAASTEDNADPDAKAKRTPSPLDDHRIAQRQKQIMYGYHTVGYLRYRLLVPKERRTADHPRTPKKEQGCSKRSWDGQLKKWRRDLHRWDPEDPIAFKAMLESDFVKSMIASSPELLSIYECVKDKIGKENEADIDGDDDDVAEFTPISNANKNLPINNANQMSPIRDASSMTGPEEVDSPIKMERVVRHLVF